jgi:hypothetical protein
MSSRQEQRQNGAVTDARIDVRDVVRGDPGVRDARDRFGGLDVPATLVGMLTALALIVLVGGLAGAAVGAVGYQTSVEGASEEVSIGALAGGIVVIFAAFLVGGWAAGRIARYDGVVNGAMTGVWALLLAAALAVLGAWLGSEYNVFANVDLPSWFSRDALTAGAIASGAVTIAAMLVGGALGGRAGERFHRRADATIARRRPGGVGRADGVREAR